MLSKKKRYLQIALNSTLSDAEEIIAQLPASERILVEAGTPFIKRYGEVGIRRVRELWEMRIAGELTFASLQALRSKGGNRRIAAFAGSALQPSAVFPYVVADVKAQDRGATEVDIALRAGASAVTVNGAAPVETLDAFITECEKQGIDAMIDMMNVEQPYKVLRKLKKLPPVVVLHRGVDEIEFNNSKPVPYHQINKIKGAFDVMISVAGGDTAREVQRAIFNNADIVVVWKEFFHSSTRTKEIAESFLREIK